MEILLGIMIFLQVVELGIFIMYIMKQPTFSPEETLLKAVKQKVKYDIANLLDPISPVEQKLERILTETAKKYDQEIDY